MRDCENIPPYWHMQDYRRLVSLKYAGFDFFAKGQSDSGFSRTVFDTFFNDDSVLNSKM